MNNVMARAWFLEHFALGGEIHEEALKKGLEAIEKQIPRKPIKTNDETGIRYTDSYRCPNCGRLFAGTGIAQYCYHCGQYLDWED